MRKPKKSLPLTMFSHTIGDKTYTAYYTLSPAKDVQNSVLTVSTGDGKTNSTQLGGLPPEHLARVLLSEIVRGISKP